VTTVIDIGCARYGGDHSIERLIEMFKPDVFWGFDPNREALSQTVADYEGGEQSGDRHRRADGLREVHYDNRAAWIFDGTIGFHPDGLNSCLTERTDLAVVPCFDLATFIARLTDKRIILKIDAERSEYELLDHLIEHRVDALLELAIVEWHCLACGRGCGRHRPDCPDHNASYHWRKQIEQAIACEIREWEW
jgi:hypothetical protein